MSDLLLFVAIGLGHGAVFAAMALGLVITYKGTGVINFAAGAMGVWCAFVFSELRLNGTLVLPVGQVDFGETVAVGPALAIAVATGVAAGVGAHFLVFRRLRHAPALARVVASVGLMLTFQALVMVRFASPSRVLDPILPSGEIEIAGVAVPRDRLWLTAIVVVAGLAATAWFRFSRLGLAIRAAAESERFAALAGHSPDVLGAAAWAVASALVAVVAVLAAPMTGISPGTFTLFVVPALACALVGRLGAIMPAVLAGLALGAINSSITFGATKTWWPGWAHNNVASAVPLVAIVVVLFALGGKLPARDQGDPARLPDVIRPRVRPGVAVALAGAGVAAVLVTGGSYRFGLITSMAVSLIALSLVVVTGLLGQVSLAQAAFAGMAGLLLSRLSVDFGIGFPLAPLLAAAGATLLGVLIAAPALRIRGEQLAVVTLAAGLAFDQVVLANRSVTSGTGSNLVPPPTFLGVDLGIREGVNTARWQFGLLTLAVLVAGALVVSNLARSDTGKRFLAVRSNERASASVGIDVARTKILGFALSAFIAGLGGSLIGYSQGSVSAASYTTLVGVSWLVFAYLGGISSVAGALLAGAFVPLGLAFVAIDRQIGASGEIYQLVAALGLIAATIFHPEGVAGAARHVVAAIRRRRVQPSTGFPTAAPPSVATATSGRAGSVHRAGSTGSPRAGSLVLDVKDLRVRFGATAAVDGVELEVHAGEVVGLIGANGAGKTTFIDAVSGFVPYTGNVRVAGEDLDHKPAFARARSGVARTWQSLELFRDLTVRENLEVAATYPSMSTQMLDLVAPSRRRRTDVQTTMTLDSLGIGDCAERTPHELSLGQQKLANVARALVSQPRLLLLDEPAAGLADSERHVLAAALGSAVDDACGALLVEHDVALVLNVCDYLYVLDRGRVIAAGSPEEVRADPVVVEAYLGAPAAPLDEPPAGDLAAPVTGAQP